MPFKHPVENLGHGPVIPVFRGGPREVEVCKACNVGIEMLWQYIQGMRQLFPANEVISQDVSSVTRDEGFCPSFGNAEMAG